MIMKDEFTRRIEAKSRMRDIEDELDECRKYENRINQDFECRGFKERERNTNADSGYKYDEKEGRWSKDWLEQKIERLNEKLGATSK